MIDDESLAASPKSCFVIAPIGGPATEIRKRSDQVLRHIIRPVVEDLGYTARRADEIDQAGLITTQILDCILNDDLVIADLTDQNPNVFYELAVRHAIRRPFVQLMASGQKIPFDVQGLRTISIDHTDLDSVAAGKEQLLNTIKAIEAGGPVETPMSVALSLKDLKGSTNPEEQGLSQIMETLQVMRRDIRSPQRRISPSSDIDFHNLRRFVSKLAYEGRLDVADLQVLIDVAAVPAFERWVKDVIIEMPAPQSQPTFEDEPPF